MDVGVGLAVVPRDRIEHRLRLLGGRGVVEIDQRLAVDRPAQDREVGTDPLDVEARRGRAVHVFTPCTASGTPVSITLRRIYFRQILGQLRVQLRLERTLQRLRSGRDR